MAERLHFSPGSPWEYNISVVWKVYASTSKELPNNSPGWPRPLHTLPNTAHRPSCGLTFWHNVVSHRGFNVYFPHHCRCRGYFYVLVAIVCFLWWSIFSDPLSTFSFGLFVFLGLSFEGSVGANPVTGKWLANTSSPSVTCLFLVLTVSFKEHRVLILMKSSLSGELLVSYLRNFRLTWNHATSSQSQKETNFL